MAKTKVTRAKKPAPAKISRLSGPRSIYRHKVRSPVSLLFTQDGHDKMQAELERTGYSRSDYFEKLLHEHGHEIEPLQAGELEAAATGT